jgi:hypothetical protein
MPGEGKAMDKTDFLSIMQLANADVKVIDPDTVGIALVVVHRNVHGELEVQIGSNIPEEALFEAVLDASRGNVKRKTRHG